MYYKQDEETVYRSLWILHQWYEFFIRLSYQLSMYYNIVLCVDLQLMVRKPLIQRSSRIFWYHIGALIFTLLYSGFHFTTSWGNSHTRDFDIMLIVEYLTFCIVGTWSWYYALKRLGQPGVSRELHGLVFKRHVAFIVFVAATNFSVLNFAFCNLLECDSGNIFIVYF